MSDDVTALALPDAEIGPQGSGRRMELAARRAGLRNPSVPIDELAMICRGAIDAKMLPRSITTEGQALTIAIKGYELGIPPMQAFASIHVIEGVPSCSAQLMLGLAYRHLPEFDLQVVESTGDACEMRMRRGPTRSWISMRYTLAEAKAPKVTQGRKGMKKNWERHPDDMLRARVISKALKIVAPDVFSGLYLPEEAMSIVSDDIPDPDALDEVVPVEAAVAQGTTADRSAPQETTEDDARRAALVADLMDEAVGGDRKRAAKALEIDVSNLAELKALSLDDLVRLHEETFDLGEAPEEGGGDE